MRITILLLLALLASGVTYAQDNIDSLIIGGQPSREMLESLAAAGYEAVLSTRASDEIDWDEGAVVDSLGMMFVSIPMGKPVDDITDEQLEQFDAFMQQRKRSLLHCGSGNRVAALWAVWLVRYKGVGADEALARAEAAGMRPSMRDVAARHMEMKEIDEQN